MQSKSPGSEGTWSTKAELLTPRYDVGVAALNSKIYVLGGGAPGQTASQLNQEYDPATDRWRERAPIPQGVTHGGVAGDNGKIYVVGGFTASIHAVAVDKAFEYDLATDTWRQLPPINSPRGSVGVAVANGKVHAIGGRGLNNVTVATHEVYDPATGKWSQAAPLPAARDHIGVIVLGGRIHVIGGRISNHISDNSKPTVGARGLPYDLVTNGPNTTQHDVYDPETNSWQSAAPLPTARSNGAAVYYHGLILYAGGECKKPDPKGGGETFDENEGYDSEDKPVADARAVACWTARFWRGNDRAICLFHGWLSGMRRRSGLRPIARFQVTLRIRNFRIHYTSTCRSLAALRMRRV